MSIYFNGNKLLTYNCLFNFVVGARGCGKSFYCKKRALNTFLKKGKKFIYLRRYDTELQDTAPDYFNDMLCQDEFKNVKLEYKAGQYFINGELAGYAIALSCANRYKSIAFPDVDFIIFDEFLTEGFSFTGYLKNEVKQFLNFYMSVDRYRGTTVFFLGNATDFINPYFLYFNLKIPYNCDTVRQGECLLHVIRNVEFENYAKNTRFGKLIQNSEFSDYAIDNNFADNQLKFIGKKSANSEYYFTLKLNNILYGVWIDYKKQRLFVSKDVQPDYILSFALTLDDHASNTILIKNINRNAQMKKFVDSFLNARVMFESIEIRVIITATIRGIIC